MNHNRRHPTCQPVKLVIPSKRAAFTTPVVAMISCVDILAGDELTFDYADRQSGLSFLA